MKNRGIITVLFVLIIGLVAYIVFKPIQTAAPVTSIVNSEPNTQTQTNQNPSRPDNQVNKTPSAQPLVVDTKTISTPVGWKVFSANGLSISAPSDFKMKTASELGVSTVLTISSPKIIGEIYILKFPDQSSYDEQFAESNLKRMQISGELTLVHSNYVINGVSGKEYKVKTDTESVFTTSFILFPSKLVAISIIPDENSFAGYTNAQVTQMIKSIKF